MNKVYVTAIVKDVPPEEYSRYLPPMKARRMGKLLKRALVTALKAMEISGIENPDAIINGTALGCMAPTVQLLQGIADEGESVSMPTAFMLSTHNTVATQIAIYTGNHGYNNTYSHREISFQCALHDAWLQLRTGRLRTALVCANDELTEFQQQHRNVFGDVLVKDRSEAWMLSVDPGDHPLCELESVRVVYRKDMSYSAEINQKPI